MAADTHGLTLAANLLSNGELVAFPTETVYGLGADATNDAAITSIFAAKNRPSFNPLIVHTKDAEDAQKLARFNGLAERLSTIFWPGALTIVLPRREDGGLSLLVSAGLDTVAVRVPKHPLAHEFLAACRCPVAAPSANFSGEVSPTQASHVAQSLPLPNEGGPAIILDGGPCRVGLESTVIDLSTARPTILRHGGIPKEHLEKIIGTINVAETNDKAPRSPGMLSQHYAPATPLRMNAANILSGEAFLGFGPSIVDATLSLSLTGDIQEAAANLFAMIRQLDNQNYSAIAVSEIPNIGLGRAINDRLRRAAHT